MAKKGDTVRYLNAVGGGVITRIDGKIAYVEEDGFENPVLISELVVTMPAEMKNEAATGANLIFNQKAFDAGKRPQPKPIEEVHTTAPSAAPETAHGNHLNILLAFEPDDIKTLSSTTFSAVLLNDSNYTLLFNFSARKDDEKNWNCVYAGDVNPNELIDLARLSHENLLEFEHVAFQCVALKKDRSFEIKSPINVVRKLDLTKFHKLHCFKSNDDFESPVLEFPLVSRDAPLHGATIDTPRLKAELSKKYKVDSGQNKKREKSPEDNPHKVLPIIEVDLHIGQLTDTLVGLRPKDMLEMQLDAVRNTMKQHSRRQGQKIVFIHGKGDGILRNEVSKLLKKEYPKCELRDASFQQYGFGATLVIIH